MDERLIILEGGELFPSCKNSSKDVILFQLIEEKKDRKRGGAGSFICFCFIIFINIMSVLRASSMRLVIQPP